MSRDLAHLLAFVRTTPWAILPTRGQAMLDVLSRRARGVRLSDWEIESVVDGDRTRYSARADAHNGVRGGVAVVPIYGTLVHRAHDVADASGGGLVSAEALAKTLRAADANPDVGTIVLDIDSPGGSVLGIEELGAVVESLSKPVVAVANSMAASAAYWIASLADELIVTPSGEVGSIGVIAVHEDHSEALAKDGVKLTFVTAGKNKAEGNAAEPLSEEARAHLQSQIDAYYSTFVKTVARGRGVSRATVESDFGQGRMFTAQEAKRLGMVDRVATLDETVARIAGGGRVKKRAARATRQRFVTGVDDAGMHYARRVALEPCAECKFEQPFNGPPCHADGCSARAESVIADVPPKSPIADAPAPAQAGSEGPPVNDIDLREREAEALARKQGATLSRDQEN